MYWTREGPDVDGGPFAGPMVKTMALDVPPPGAGLVTATLAVPALAIFAADTSAESSVALR